MSISADWKGTEALHQFLLSRIINKFSWNIALEDLVETNIRWGRSEGKSDLRNLSSAIKNSNGDISEYAVPALAVDNLRLTEERREVASLRTVLSEKITKNEPGVDEIIKQLMNASFRMGKEEIRSAVKKLGTHVPKHEKGKNHSVYVVPASLLEDDGNTFTKPLEMPEEVKAEEVKEGER
jgi:hypothetical protein